MSENYVSSLVTAEWLEPILSGSFGKKVVIRELELSPGLENGENYASITTRIRAVISPSEPLMEAEDNKVNNQEEQQEVLQLFAKLLPSTEGQREFIVKYSLFEREASVYNHLLPAVKNLLDGIDNATGEQFVFDCYPKVYGADKDVIIMEDLGCKGFGMGNRQTGLTMDEMSISLKAIARFHALTYVLVRSEPNITPREYKERFPFINKDLYEYASIRPLYGDTPAAMRMLEAVKKHSPSILQDESEMFEGQADLEDLITRLKAYAGQDFAVKVEEIALTTSDMDCFLLGDAWTNNIMFRYEKADDGKLKPVDIQLLDFQIVRFSRPLPEVAFFIYTSADRDCFQRPLDLLRVYYDEFLSTIESLLQHRPELKSRLLSRDSFTFEDMVEEYEKGEEAGFLASVAWLPLMVLTKDDFPKGYGEGDFGDYMGDLMRLGLSGPAGKNVMLRFLDHAKRARSVGIL